jgi:hypothetical protein
VRSCFTCMPSSRVVEPTSRSLKCLESSETAEAMADSLLETRVISSMKTGTMTLIIAS